MVHSLQGRMRRRVAVAGLAVLPGGVNAACRGGGSPEAEKHSPDLSRGAALYQTYCQTCHGGANTVSCRAISPFS